jgi:probable rRNA maturation factor
MQSYIDLQIADDGDDHPPPSAIETWVNSTLCAAGYRQAQAELTVRIVGPEEIRALNRDYRGKDKPTNVLSFPADIPDHIDLPLLGDLIVCADVVRNEAAEQHKSTQDHWAHMVIHGTLHLLGFDHIDDDEAQEMELLEISILQQLGIDNPYLHP